MEVCLIHLNFCRMVVIFWENYILERCKFRLLMRENKKCIFNQCYRKLNEVISGIIRCHSFFRNCNRFPNMFIIQNVILFLLLPQCAQKHTTGCRFRAVDESSAILYGSFRVIICFNRFIQCKRESLCDVSTTRGVISNSHSTPRFPRHRKDTKFGYSFFQIGLTQNLPKTIKICFFTFENLKNEGM